MCSALAHVCSCGFLARNNFVLAIRASLEVADGSFDSDVAGETPEMIHAALRSLVAQCMEDVGRREHAVWCGFVVSHHLLGLPAEWNETIVKLGLQAAEDVCPNVRGGDLNDIREYVTIQHVSGGM